LTRLTGHTLHKEGAAYTRATSSLPGRPTTTGGLGQARCSCGIFSNFLPSAMKRKEWHRNHKAAIRNLAARQEALGTPSHSVSIATFITPPYGGWALHFTGFESATPQQVAHVGMFKGETTGDLVFRAVEGLLGVPDIKDQPILIHLNHKHLRELLAASLHLLPDTWALSVDRVDGEVMTACKALYDLHSVTLRESAAPKGRTIDIHGKRTALVAADASCRLLGTVVDGIEETQASAGWVIFDLDSKRIETGYRRLPDGPVRIEQRELEAIECALQAIAAHPVGATRKLAIQKIVVMSDSANAVAMANDWHRRKDPIVARIQALVQQIDIPLEFQWVKGHAKNIWNIAADALARHAQRAWPSAEDEAQSLASIEGKLRMAHRFAENSRRQKLANERRREQAAAAVVAKAPVDAKVSTAAINFLASRACNQRPELQHGMTA
jgi:ribonuclease HI